MHEHDLSSVNAEKMSRKRSAVTRIVMTDPQERPERIQDLAKTILRASEAMSREQWADCQRLLGESARMARVLHLLDQRELE